MNRLLLALVAAAVLAACDTQAPEDPVLPPPDPLPSAAGSVTGTVNGVVWAGTIWATERPNRGDDPSAGVQYTIRGSLPIPAGYRNSFHIRLDTLVEGTFDLTTLYEPEYSLGRSFFASVRYLDAVFPPYEPVSGTLVLEAVPATGGFVGTFEAVTTPGGGDALDPLPDTLQFEDVRFTVDGPLR